MRLTVILFTLIDDTSQCYFVMEIMNLSSDKDDYYFSVAHPFISKRSMASLLILLVSSCNHRRNTLRDIASLD